MLNRQLGHYIKQHSFQIRLTYITAILLFSNLLLLPIIQCYATSTDAEQALSDYNNEVTRTGKEDLPRLEEISLGLIEHGVKTGDATTQFFIGRSLYTLKDPRGLKMLQRVVVETKDRTLRMALVSMLGGLGDASSVPALTSVLKRCTSSGVRYSAAFNLGKIASPESVPALLEALKEDKDYEVRRDSASSLGKIGDKKAVQGLIRALDDKNVNVRAYATEALGRIGDPSAIAHLRSHLNDGSNAVKWRILVALAELSAKPGIDELKVAFSKAINWKKLRDYESRKWRSPDKRLKAYRKLFFPRKHIIGKKQSLTAQRARASAAYLIWNPEGLDILLDELISEAAKSEDTDESCLDAIRLRCDPRDLPILHKLLKSGSDWARDSAAEILNNDVRDTSSVPVLVSATSDLNYNVRRNAAEALGKIGNTRATNALIQALADRSAVVWQKAFEALIRIGKPALPKLLNALSSSDKISVRRLPGEKLISEAGVPERARVGGKYSGLKAIVKRSKGDREKYGDFYEFGTGAVGDGTDAQKQGFIVFVNDRVYIWAYSKELVFRQKGLLMLAVAEIYSGKHDPMTDARIRVQPEEILSHDSTESSGAAGSIRELARLLEAESPVQPQDENEILAIALASESQSIQLTARDIILEKHDPTLLPVLKAQWTKRTGEEDILSRINYDSVLAEMGDLEGMQGLRDASQSAEPSERLLAQSSLAHLGDLSVLPSLRKQLTDKESYRRYPAAASILQVIQNARKRSKTQ